MNGLTLTSPETGRMVGLLIGGYLRTEVTRGWWMPGWELSLQT